MIRLVTRGDDSGCCHGANAAIRDAFRQGILRNTSLMVPAPAFEEAAAMLRALPGLCIGLHATVTAEWAGVRWGPVLGAEGVPSLVREDGTFFTTTQALQESGPDPEEMAAEVRAQLLLAREHGLEVSYMDTHMGFTWIAGMEEPMAALAREEGLIYRPEGLQRLPRPAQEDLNPVDRLLAGLAAGAPGTYLAVGHPCYDTEDAQRLYHQGQEPGRVAAERDLQRRMFMDRGVLDYCGSHEVRAIRYTEI